MEEHEQYISYRDIMSGADFVTNAILIFRIAYSTVMFYEIVNSVSKKKKKKIKKKWWYGGSNVIHHKFIFKQSMFLILLLKPLSYQGVFLMAL